MGRLNNINFGGANFDNPSDHMELTQAEYDALPSSEKLNGKVYFITDGINSNVVLNEVKDSKAFVNCFLNTGNLNVIQLLHKDANGEKVSALNIEYTVGSSTGTVSNPDMTMHYWDTDRWVMIGRYRPYVDSGWVNTDVPGISVRRKNGVVFIRFQGGQSLVCEANTWTQVGNLPEGFFPDDNMDVLVPSSTLVSFILFRFTTSGHISIYSPTAIAADTVQIRGSGSYPVDNVN